MNRREFLHGVMGCTVAAFVPENCIGFDLSGSQPDTTFLLRMDGMTDWFSVVRRGDEWSVFLGSSELLNVGGLNDGTGRDERAWMQFWCRNGEIRFKPDGDNAILIDWFRVYDLPEESVVKVGPVVTITTNKPSPADIAIEWYRGRA